MARGKQAAASANRRAESAHEVIDRLTTEVANAKLRAKEAEQRAARLEGIEKLLVNASIRNDDLLASAMEKLSWWKKVASEDRKRREEAWQEVWRVLLPDVLHKEDKGGSKEDRRQFVMKRYPAITLALLAGDRVLQNDAYAWHDSQFAPIERKLSQQQLRRLQRVSGERAIIPGDDRDVAEIWTEMLEATQAEFNADEILEYAGIADWVTKSGARPTPRLATVQPDTTTP